MTQDHHDQDESETKTLHLVDRTNVSRRGLIQGTGATVAATGMGLLAAGHLAAQEATPGASPAATPTHDHDMSGMAEIPVDANGDPAKKFFNGVEAATVEALVSRIMPGTPDDPGAREAGVVFYIDGQLAGSNVGYTLKTYTQGPFLSSEASSGSVGASSQNNLFDYVYVQDEEVPRYGYQSVISPQDLYRRGVMAVNAYATATFGGSVADLTEDQQDQIVTALADGSATGFDSPTPTDFFTQLRNDTIEGMFSDPMYGGNRDMVGWKLIGYPGAQVLYTSADMANQDFQRDPQSLGQMISNSQGN